MTRQHVLRGLGGQYDRIQVANQRKSLRPKNVRKFRAQNTEKDRSMHALLDCDTRPTISSAAAQKEPAVYVNYLWSSSLMALKTHISLVRHPERDVPNRIISEIVVDVGF